MLCALKKEEFMMAGHSKFDALNCFVLLQEVSVLLPGNIILRPLCLLFIRKPMSGSSINDGVGISFRWEIVSENSTKMR